MEGFWYFLASALAGISTGLVGLSAATVMVPILIVLCPSFASQTGAYQATAIALASDIFGSAITTYTYIRHKNIDLKRGWIMFLCIISMCTLGSYAAWKAGNQVLGGFTLFLTFCIGIRFLLKPSTQYKKVMGHGKPLDLKGILISVFFGLSIGFGTGFVGTGGGMMMLIVFTAFLGMDLKSAVGTSTFIMTFTALIGSVSHIAVHPAIVFERWNVLLFCMLITTLFSLISARFANRVNDTTVGYVTGILLTIIGAGLIILYYWDWISQFELLKDILSCFGGYIFYIIPAALAVFALRMIFRLPHFVFRKLLHLIAFCSTTAVVLLAKDWKSASLTMTLFALIVYPILCLAQKWKGFSKLLVQKRPGEIKSSLLQMFLGDALIIAIGWGVFACRFIPVCATLMWGFGDGAAALIGKKFGRHRASLAFADKHKTMEGFWAMFVFSSFAGMISLALFSSYSFIWIVMICASTSIFSAYIELISRKGYDTVTVPLTNMICLILWALIL